jgi:spore coat polysaccharide biosynthesis protein SpsF (cytidylyltransferase family)
MSDDEMKRMILMLQARLNEKEQVKKVVVSASKNETEDVIYDLPF